MSITNKFIIITNQSGVSRGLIKENDLLRINDFIMNELKDENAIANILPLLEDETANFNAFFEFEYFFRH